MNLQTLIQQLETAAALASDGDISVDSIGQLVRRTDDAVELVAIPLDDPPSSAQAIAIRHNTAIDVIRRLKDERGHRDKMWAERDQWRERAEKAEAMLKLAHEVIAEDSMCSDCESKDVAVRCRSCGKEWGY